VTSRFCAVVAGGLLLGAVLASAGPASALVVNPYFTGHGTIDGTNQVTDWVVYDAGLQSIFGQSSIDIDVAHGMVDDGGTLGGPITPGDWGFDFDIWAPLVNNIDITAGGQVTYGFPAAGVFAVTWIDAVNASDHSVRNTFQVVFVGTSGFHTNTGFAIAPGSVIFAYGAPGDPSGTVNLSAGSPAAIGMLLPSGLITLASFGIGDANGVLSTADVAALQSSGDPFLFNRGPYGIEQPVAFASLAERVPEPAAAWMLGLGTLGAIGAARRRAPRGE